VVKARGNQQDQSNTSAFSVESSAYFPVGIYLPIVSRAVPHLSYLAWLYRKAVTLAYLDIAKLL
jgi:hypothetical protein